MRLRLKREKKKVKEAGEEKRRKAGREKSRWRRI